MKQKKRSITSFDFDSCLPPTYAVAAFINLVGELGPIVFIAKIFKSSTPEPLGKAHQSNKG